VSSGQPIEIRRAGVADLDLLAPLFDDYRQFYRQPADPVVARQYLASRLEREESVVFLAASDTVGYGFVQLYPSFCSVAARPIWILYDLFVAPAARGHGYGRRLMQLLALSRLRQVPSGWCSRRPTTTAPPRRCTNRLAIAGIPCSGITSSLYRTHDP
jgi:GNAT superfamily N-acetyltransferase